MKEYRVENTQVSVSDVWSLQNKLRKYARKGWQVVNVMVNPRTEWYVVVLERDGE